MKDSLFHITHDLYIQILKPSDVTHEYVQWMNDYEVVKYTEQKFTAHSFEDVCEFVRQKYESKNDFLFGIYFNKKHIGNVKLGPINFNHKVADISMIIGDKDMWGKGIATKVTKKIISFGFEVIGLEKITLTCNSLNRASLKMFLNRGFSVEAIRKEQIIFEGKRVDQISLGILPSGLIP